MSVSNENKVRILKVLKILRKYSDCDHKINTPRICSMLSEEGITADRRSVYNDISALVRCGHDINRATASRDGFYYDCRELEVPEVRLLIDAVSSAPFITKKKTDELTEKLLSVLSVYQANDLKGSIFSSDRMKFTNEEIYYNIDCINEALRQNKKIRFMYYHKIIKNGRLVNNEGKEFTVSPYGIFWADDKYYVAANYEKYDDISNFRIDRMRKVVMETQDIRPLSDIMPDYGTDMEDYVRKSVNAFYGSEDDVTLEVPLDMLDIISDKFGEQLKITGTGDRSVCISIRLSVSEGLINWLIPYCDRIKVLKPDYLCLSVKERVSQIHDALCGE